MVDRYIRLDIGRCLNDAMEAYKRNFLVFLVAAILFDLLTICSLLILAGPLWGGSAIMSLNTLRDPNHKPRLGDLFAAFDRFGTLAGLFFLTIIPLLIAYMLLLIPGIFLSAMWLFAVYLIVDANLGVMDSLQTSWRIVKRRGLWPNLAIAFIVFAMTAGPSAIPGVGWLIGLLLTPMVWLMVASAYLQEVREPSDFVEFQPRGFPVGPTAPQS